MKAEFLNPFIVSISKVLTNSISETPKMGKPYLRVKYPYTAGDVVIIIGITGSLTGQCVISLSENCAKGIAAAMMMEERIEDLDEYAQSAIAEMANMIIANATIGLADAGYICDITPPSVITGKNLEVSAPMSISTVVIPLEIGSGEIDMNLSLVETSAIAGSTVDVKRNPVHRAHIQ
jgi:chemotaxis protein CheX